MDGLRVAGNHRGEHGMPQKQFFQPFRYLFLLSGRVMEKPCPKLDGMDGGVHGDMEDTQPWECFPINIG